MHGRAIALQNSRDRVQGRGALDGETQVGSGRGRHDFDGLFCSCGCATNPTHAIFYCITSERTDDDTHAYSQLHCAEHDRADSRAW